MPFIPLWAKVFLCRNFLCRPLNAEEKEQPLSGVALLLLPFFYPWEKI